MEGEQIDYKLDKSQMIKVLEEFPKQCRDGLKLGKSINFGDTEIKKIVITGMGGSGIIGDLLKAYNYHLKIPLHVNKGYFLPGHIDRQTLVIAISYSGNTEETINSYRQARGQGAQVLIVASGGSMEKAEGSRIHKITVPKGVQPRNAVGFMFFSILKALEVNGIVETGDEIVYTLEALKKPGFRDKGLDLAKRFVQKTPIIYTSQRFKAVGLRWKQQFNENAKQMAFHNTFSEMNHNELEAYEFLPQGYEVIIMQDEDDYHRIKKRMSVFKKVIKNKARVTELNIKGECFLSRIFTLMYLGDWTTYYLALLLKRDPTQVDFIENFKKQIK
ncbi:bifunctional phosphoglucose/phosphomannose isomerase [Candidatus Woesearchaeota archaeon]|nr:bifunctional phosphoglucose/phosphomannose isomerase [Candidatus Woesearchaeota archaeon]